MSAMCELIRTADAIRYASEVRPGDWDRLLEGIERVTGHQVRAALEKGMEEREERVKEVLYRLQVGDVLRKVGEVMESLETLRERLHVISQENLT